MFDIIIMSYTTVLLLGYTPSDSIRVRCNALTWRWTAKIKCNNVDQIRILGREGKKTKIWEGRGR